MTFLSRGCVHYLFFIHNMLQSREIEIRFVVGNEKLLVNFLNNNNNNNNNNKRKYSEVQEAIE